MRNSFNLRITAAVLEWDVQLDRAGYTRPISIVRVSDSTGPENILIEEYEADDPDVWGTQTKTASGTCPTHATWHSQMYHATVYWDRSDVWFTQDDSRRALWESCPTNGMTPAYTCSKQRDLESLLIHEIGHVLGLPHPEVVDGHDAGLSPNAATVANCSSLVDRASMCRFIQRWRTSGRTLHAWDRESLRIVEVRH